MGDIDMHQHTYQQKFQTVMMVGTHITAIHIHQATVWVGTAQGLCQMRAGCTEPAGLDVPVTRIAADSDGSLWVGTEVGLYKAHGSTWQRVTDLPVCAMCMDDSSQVWSTDGHTVLVAGQGTEQAVQPADLGIRGLLVYEGQLWLATDQGIICGDRRWTERDGLLSNDVRSLMMDAAGHLWVGTPAGISLFDRRDTWYSVTGKNGLPYEDVRAVIPGPEGVRWVVTGVGVACYANGRWDYYASKRWLPSDGVTDLAVDEDGSAWIGTTGGLACIERQPYDFEKKAAFFEERIADRHNRYGFVTECHLESSGDTRSFLYEASDNDGLWTALYVAAESFCYAATGNLEARERSRKSMQALLSLEEKTTLDGFPARAIVKQGEQRVIQSHGEWHTSADGEWLWKGDTSSDEIDGHMFAYGIYYDLVADAGEKQQLEDLVGRMMGYIIDHDFLLIDVDGQPTRWGVWSPSYLNGPWKDQQGLNSLEILAHLKTAHHITGDKAFQDAYEYLIQTHHYALNTVDQKVMPPGIVNHSDDELAFISYYPLLRYEEEPSLRALYLLSLERQWQCERPERCPLWNFIYGALTGNRCDREFAVETLERIPMDLITWTVRNSHRTDIQLAADDRFQTSQSTFVLPPDERPMMRWNGNPYQLDGGRDGRSEDDGTFYLLAYWLGRYHGLVL